MKPVIIWTGGKGLYYKGATSKILSLSQLLQGRPASRARWRSPIRGYNHMPRRASGRPSLPLWHVETANPHA
eukprot:3468611-Rhodomonas_salina.1